MNKKIKPFLFLLLCLLTVNIVYASNVTFTLAQLIEEYLHNSYDGRIRSEQILRQNYALDNTKAAFLPKFTCSLQTPGHYYSRQGATIGDSIRNDHNYLSGNLIMSETFPFNAELSISKSLTYDFYEDQTYINAENNINFKYYLFKKNIPKLEFKKSELKYNELTFSQKSELNSDIFELVQDYYKAIDQKFTINILEKKLVRNRNVAAMSAIEYNTGTMDILTLNQIKIQEKQTELELSEKRKTYKYYLQNLADQIGCDKISDIRIDTTLFVFRSTDFNLEHNPKIQILKSQLRSLDIDKKLVEGEFDWYLTLGVNYNWGGNGHSIDSFAKDIHTDNYSAYIGVELPIFDSRITRRNILILRSQEEEIKLQLEQKEKELKTRWNYLSEMISLLRDEIETYSELVEWADNNLNVATGKLLRGEISYSGWSQIEEDYEQCVLNLVNKKLILNQYILETQEILGNSLTDVIIP
ncbi:MAG: TolC family protein [Candidatus Cloacimonetes bacterium]|nr:TolC family protein [Candidatus Cloacimonadota bacterium]